MRPEKKRHKSLVTGQVRKSTHMNDLPEEINTDN